MSHSVVRIAVFLVSLATIVSAQSQKTPRPLQPEADVKGAAQLSPKGIGPAEIPFRDARPELRPGKPETSTGPATRTEIPVDRVFVDVAEDEAWVLGATYKAHFDAASATYIPFLGSDAPRNFPATLRLRDVTVGGEDLRLDELGIRVDGERSVTLHRGALDEVYHLEACSMEQTFVLANRPGIGAMEFTVEVATSLPFTGADARGFHFTNEFGGLTYGRATAIDADGRAQALETIWEDGRIRIRVPATLMETAAFPLTIDPVLSSVALPGIDVYTGAVSDPDVAFEAGSGRYLVVSERAFSATDHDVCSELVEADGTPVTNGFAWIDLSGVYFAQPRVAGNRIATQFLVVMSRGLPSSGTRGIHGRTRESDGSGVLGSTFQIHGIENGDKHGPDVGGDPVVVGPTYYAVTWQRDFSTTDTDIHARLVNSDGTLVGATTMFVSNGGELDRRPAISNSNGYTAFADQRWTVVFDREVGGEHDIYGFQLDWDGTVVTPVSPLHTSSADTTNAAVSTIATGPGLVGQFVIAYEIDTPSERRLGVLHYQGSTYLGGTNDLRVLEGSGGAFRRNPSVDCDGCTFTVGYTEQFGGADWDVYVSVLGVSQGSTLGLYRSRVPVATGAELEDFPIVASRGAVGGPSVEHGFVHLDQIDFAPKVAMHRYITTLAGEGLVVVPTGAQGLQLVTSGLPALGQQFGLSMPNATANALLIVGVPTLPAPICAGNLLGVNVFDPFLLVINGPSLALTLPCDVIVRGFSAAVQGADFGGNPSCAGGLRVTDTVIVTVQ